jgi:hypothetical protein
VRDPRINRLHAKLSQLGEWQHNNEERERVREEETQKKMGRKLKSDATLTYAADAFPLHVVAAALVGGMSISTEPSLPPASIPVLLLSSG